MTQPKIQNYLEASEFAYNSGTPTGAPSGFNSTFAVDTNHYDSKNNYDTFDKLHGFYAAAYELVVGGSTDIVISFEGTNIQGFDNNRVFSSAEIVDDYELYKGELPTALKEAAQFTQDVVATAKNDGISASNIYLTGHSLGGAEAEYADAETQISGTTAKLAGVTFGAPGISSSYLPSTGTSGLTDYVERGDPVGNYAYTGPNSPEGSFIHDNKIQHYGNVKFIGKSSGVSDLRNAASEFSGSTLSDKKQGLSDFLTDAEDFHLLTTYASDLKHPFSNPLPAVATLYNADALNFVSGLFGHSQT